MKQYLLGVNHTDDEAAAPSPEEMERLYKDVDAFNQELLAADAMVFGGGMHPPSTWTVVRHEDGEVITTDGPFAETREYLGGFWVIKAADFDEALAWSVKASQALQGPVEIRPFQEEVDE